MSDFCRACGASIPPRDGEGVCPVCQPEMCAAHAARRHRVQGWARFHDNGYEVSSAGDRRFSALNAVLADGRTIEEAYQLDLKGYRRFGNSWRLGKGRKPLRDIDTWAEYLALWRQWAMENPLLIEELRQLATGRVLTDRFASTPINQARALAKILSETT